MKIVTYNVNGIKARLPRLIEYLTEAQPDIVCLQELKASDVEAAAGRVFAADGNGATAWARPAAERVDFADVLIS